VLTAGLLAGALLTHFAVGSGRLGAQDKALMGMQRMGPPLYLQEAYRELDAETVAIRGTANGPVIADGVYAGAFSSPVPGSGIKHFLQTLNESGGFVVIVSPLSRIRSLKLFVDLGGQKVPGEVILTNRELGLAAIEVSGGNDQSSALSDGPPLFSGPPAGVLKVPQLVIRLVPNDNASTGYVLTSGLLSRSGRSICDTPVSPSEAGAPVGAMTAHGSLIVVGLAMPSAERGRCSILGGWAVNEFMQLVTLTQEPARTGAHLGVIVESIPEARAIGGYRGPAQGVFIISVDPDSAAAGAGLQPGDVIIGIDGQATGSLTALHHVLHGLRPSTRHTVIYVRHGRTHAVRVILGGYPGGGG
jgi:hypothetical protein